MMARNDYVVTKLAILKAWDKWAADQALDAGEMDGSKAFEFFNVLASGQSPLLDFKIGSEDEWQTVHGWLLSARRVRN